MLPPVLKYSAIALISIFEGPLLFMVSGFLMRLGAEYYLPLFVAIGNLLGDTIWYCIGYFFARKMVMRRGAFMGMTSDHIYSTERVFGKYHGRILFLSKVTLGFGTSVGIPAVLTAAGMSRVPFMRYLAFNLVGEVVLLVFFMAVGYLYGVSYLSVSRDLRLLSLVGFVIALVILAWFARRYVTKKNPLDRD